MVLKCEKDRVVDEVLFMSAGALIFLSIWDDHGSY